MKLTTIVFLFASIATAYAQDFETPYKIYDFSDVDPDEVDAGAVEQKLDSVYRTSGYDSLLQLRAYIQRSTYTGKYVSFTIGYQSSRASLEDLKSGLASLGFNELSENFSGVPWGIDFRGKKILVSYLLVPGIKNRASNADYSVEVKGINMQLAFGYDLLHLRRLHFYPQISLALQDIDISVTRKSSTTDIVNVDDLVLKPAGSELRKSSFDMSYGVELDYHVLHSISSGGIILGVRYGRVVTLTDGKFRINDSKSSYESSDSMNESFFSVVAKFYMKQ
jgi:hypothetical protein